MKLAWWLLKAWSLVGVRTSIITMAYADRHISMAQCKTSVTPVLTHWSYWSLALNHRCQGATAQYCKCTWRHRSVIHQVMWQVPRVDHGVTSAWLQIYYVANRPHDVKFTPSLTPIKSILSNDARRRVDMNTFHFYSKKIHRNSRYWDTHFCYQCSNVHYSDVIMGAIASQITSLRIVYSTVYLDADQRKHQSSASLAFVWGIHRGPVNSPHKWPVTRKMFPFDDVIVRWHLRSCFCFFAIMHAE